jgi:hypothetical protein
VRALCGRGITEPWKPRERSGDRAAIFEMDHERVCGNLDILSASERRAIDQRSIHAISP